MEKDINKRKVLKGTRYLLLRNGADIFDKEYKTRLDNVLDMNRPLSQAYYLKKQLSEIWMQPNKQAAEKVMLDWVKQAQEEWPSRSWLIEPVFWRGTAAPYRPGKRRGSTIR